MFQLLKGLNPDMHLLEELMLPQSMTYLASASLIPDVDSRQLHLLSPAYISGSGKLMHACVADLFFSPPTTPTHHPNFSPPQLRVLSSRWLVAVIAKLHKSSTLLCSSHRSWHCW